jgi:hypothetical protein
MRLLRSRTLHVMVPPPCSSLERGRTKPFEYEIGFWLSNEQRPASRAASEKGTAGEHGMTHGAKVAGHCSCY